MTQEELLKENEKLNARLQKAVSVFTEQKAQIERLTAERDAALAKTDEANKQDQLFFEQQQEIDQLKQTVSDQTTALNNATEVYKKMQKEKDEEITKLNTRIEKAVKAHEEQKSVIALLGKQNEGFVNCIRAVQDACMKSLQEMQ